MKKFLSITLLVLLCFGLLGLIGAISAEEMEYLLEDYGVTALIIGLVVTMIMGLALWSQLKSVRQCNEATNYVVPGSFRLTRQGDYYLYRTVTKTKRSKESK